MAIILPFVILLLQGLWLWCLLDCAFRRRFTTAGERWTWLLALLFLNVFAAAAYVARLVRERRGRVREGAAARAPADETSR